MSFLYMTGYDEEWERRKLYLARRILNVPSLSIVREEDTNSDHREVTPGPPSNPPSRPPSYPPTPSSSSTLPSLIIEPEPRVNKHDEPEEFYQQLEIKMRRVYKRLFIEGKSDVDSDFSEIPIDNSKRREFNEEIEYEEENSGNDIESNDEMEVTDEDNGNADQEMEITYNDNGNSNQEIEITDKNNENVDQEMEETDEDTNHEDNVMETDKDNTAEADKTLIGEELNENDTSVEVYPKSTSDTAVKSASLSSRPDDSDVEETTESENGESCIQVTFKADIHRDAGDESELSSLLENIKVPDKSDHASSQRPVIQELEVMRTLRHLSSGSQPRHVLDVSCPELPDPQASRSMEAHSPTFSQEPVSAQSNLEVVSMELTMENEVLHTSTPVRVDKTGMSKSLENLSVAKHRDEDSVVSNSIDEDIRGVRDSKGKEGSVTDDNNGKGSEKSSKGSRDESFNWSGKTYTVKGISIVEGDLSEEADSTGGDNRHSSGDEEEPTNHESQLSGVDKQPSGFEEEPSGDKELLSGDKERQSSGHLEEPSCDDGKKLSRDEVELSRDKEEPSGDKKQQSNGDQEEPSSGDEEKLSRDEEKLSRDEAEPSGDKELQSNGDQENPSSDDGEELSRVGEELSRDEEEPCEDIERQSNKDQENPSSDDGKELSRVGEELSRVGEELSRVGEELSRDEEEPSEDIERQSNGYPEKPSSDEELSRYEEASSMDEEEPSMDEEEPGMDELQSTRKRNGATPSVSAKKARYEDASAQTVDFEAENRRILRNLILGTPKVYNLCSCAFHACRR